MKTHQRWLWLGARSNIDIVVLFRAGIVPLLCTASVVIAPFLPATFGFGIALAALLLGPAWELPGLLFPREYLTVPESLLITILGSTFIDTITFFVLNAIGIELTIQVISSIIIGVSFLFKILSIIIRSFKSKPIVIQSEEQHWIAFIYGILTAVSICTIIYILFYNKI